MKNQIKNSTSIMIAVSAVASFGYSQSQMQLLAQIQGPLNERFAEGLIIGPDWDGDGVAEIVVGSPGSNASAGKVQIFSGASLQPINSRNGIHASGGLGFDFSLVDYDNNGVLDVLACSAWQAWPSDGLSEVAVLALPNLSTIWSKSGSGESLFGFSASAIPQPSGGYNISVVEQDSNCAGTDAGAVYCFSPSGQLVWSRCADRALDKWGSGKQTSAIADVTGDGVLDLFVPCRQGYSFISGPGYIRAVNGATGQIIWNVNGDGYPAGFAQVRPSPDLDADGKRDVAVMIFGFTSSSGQNTQVRFLSSASGALLASSSLNGVLAYVPYAVGDDINLDGLPEIVFERTLASQNVLVVQSGNTEISTFVLPQSTGVASDTIKWTGDLDGDTVPDVAIGNAATGKAYIVSVAGLFDCNGNGAPDSQDIATGVAADCNTNGRPDSCEANPGNDCNADSILDACQLTALTDCNNNSRLDTCDLASGAPDCNGNQILDVCEQLTAANDCNANGLLDYCELVAGTVPDCDLNGRPDSCDLAAGLPDCNLNQVPDACDLGAGTSNDGDLNNIPDECSLDCNANGLLDTAECAQGLVADCNGNLVPDSCDLVAGVPDCNTNGVPDSCDVAGGQDCNANGQPDACDLAAGGSDCNGNQQLDSCELAAGGGDCNGNQQFDACELLAGAPDCNGNGALDACDIAAGAADCDGNQVPDACQPLDAASDCNANLILDVCDILGGAPDCNGNGRPDSCDVDTNGDQIPDECQDGGTLYCFGDGAANSTPCPCGGVGAPRSGCPNSVNPAGGYLVATGLPSRIADTLVLRASQMPPVATVLYFQGTSQASTASGTIGTVFGDGLRCAAGAVVRVGFRTNSAGASEIPSGGSPALHIAGQIPATGAVTRYYQGWYRDVNPSFCTANRYNLTNGVAVVWVP